MAVKSALQNEEGKESIGALRLKGLRQLMANSRIACSRASSKKASMELTLFQQNPFCCLVQARTGSITYIVGPGNCLQNRTWVRITIPIDLTYAYIKLFPTKITPTCYIYQLIA